MIRIVSLLSSVLSAAAYPSYLGPCTNDTNTRLKKGSVIMGVPVTAAPASVSLQVLRDGKEMTCSSFAEGELLELKISGLAAGSMAALRSNDDSNTTLQIDSTQGLFQAACPSQIYVAQGKTLPSTSSVFFRPGCSTGVQRLLSSSARMLELTLVSATGPGNPVLLSSVSLFPQGRQDPSCHGGPAPTLPPPAKKDPTYSTLIWIHRSSVILSWGLIFPLGISLVRNYPSTNRVKVHRAIQTTGLLVEIVDFSCIFTAHTIGPDGTGPAPGDSHFGGTIGSSPGATHKQRGLFVFICILAQVLLGFLRPKPHPMTLKRRLFGWLHRSLGDGAMLVAWLQIWEAVSQVAGEEQGTFLALAIVAGLFMISSMVVVPLYFMIVASLAESDNARTVATASAPLAAQASRELLADDVAICKSGA